MADNGVKLTFDWNGETYWSLVAYIAIAPHLPRWLATIIAILAGALAWVNGREAKKQTGGASS